MTTTSVGTPICIDLFSGCGGLTLGAKLAGLPTAAAVEVDRHAAATYAANFPKTNVIRDDIRTLKPHELPRPPGPLIVMAGPPCQPFSASNQRSRGPLHPNNTLYTEAVRIVRHLDPDIVVFENVEGFGVGAARMYHDDLCRRLRGLGYHVASRVFCAADFGAPQLRRRLFVVASRRPLDLHFPITPEARVTVGEAIGDLPLLRVGEMTQVSPYRSGPASSYARRLRGNLKNCTGHLVTNNAAHVVERYGFIPQGGNWKDIPSQRLQTYSDARRCHTGIYHRLSLNLPAKVIGNFRKNMLIHPTQDRGLSIREAARLQSFPDAFTFHGSIGQQQQQVGNAVPPLLASAILSKLSASLEPRA